MTTKPPASDAQDVLGRDRQDDHTLDFTIDRERRRPGQGGLLGRMADGLRALGYASPIYQYRLKGRHPLKLLASPDDPWPGDEERGLALLEGTMIAAGHRVNTTNGALWPAIGDQSRAFQNHAHSFAWLRDLDRLTDRSRAQVVAEGLTRGWLKQFDEFHPMAWTANVLALRLQQWMTHAPLILSTHDLVYRSAVLNALVRQARHLSRAVESVTDPMERLDCLTGLILTGVLLPEGDSRLHQGQRLLRRLLEELVLPDGTILTRRYRDGLHVMGQLNGLRNAYYSRQMAVPDWLLQAQDRLAPFIKALRHQDAQGSPAHFNGAGGEPAGLVDRLLTAADARSRSIDHMPFGGFQRMKHRRSLIILDAGPPPARALSAHAHAGTLSFEFSDGQAPMIVNLGGADNAPALNPELAALIRTTAAHSTLVVEDRNSTRFDDDGLLDAGVTQVRGSRADLESGTRVIARHDGYLKRFGVWHERRLLLSRDGDRLTGEDRLVAPKALTRPVSFDIRFHLHPSVNASATQDGHSVILRLANRHGWRLRASSAMAVLEESLYLDPADAPRKTQQIVLSGQCDGDGVQVPWCLERLEAGH